MDVNLRLKQYFSLNNKLDQTCLDMFRVAYKAEAYIKSWIKRHSESQCNMWIKILENLLNDINIAINLHITEDDTSDFELKASQIQWSLKYINKINWLLGEHNKVNDKLKAFKFEERYLKPNQDILFSLDERCTKLKDMYSGYRYGLRDCQVLVYKKNGELDEKKSSDAVIKTLCCDKPMTVKLLSEINARDFKYIIK